MSARWVAPPRDAPGLGVRLFTRPLLFPRLWPRARPWCRLFTRPRIFPRRARSQWHLGINAETSDDGAWLPYTHGFEHVYHTLPYSNHWACDESNRHSPLYPEASNCFLYANATVMQQPYSHHNLSAVFAKDATDFIAESAAQSNALGAARTPFFLYYAFAHMHVSMFNGPQFDDTSANGLWGDGVREMDWAAGEVLDALKANGVDDDTIVFFTSDHGPHIELCLEGGTAGPLRGGKADSSWEGGMRVPGIVRWPAGIAAAGRVVDALASTMDIYATVRELAGAAPHSAAHPLDGRSLVPILARGAAAASVAVHDVLPFYCSSRIMAARSGDYKLVFFREDLPDDDYATTHCTNGLAHGEFFESWPCFNGGHVHYQNPPLLFNVASDPAERYPISFALPPAPLGKCVGAAGSPGWEVQNGTGGGGPGVRVGAPSGFNLSAASVEACRALCCADAAERCVSVTLGPTVTAGSAGWSCFLNPPHGDAPFARNATLMAFVNRTGAGPASAAAVAHPGRGPSAGRHENMTFAQIASQIIALVAKHNATLAGDVGAPQIHGDNHALMPCCNPPSCTCNYPPPDFEARREL